MSAARKVEDIMAPEELINEMISGAHSHICQADGWMYEEEMQSVSALIKDPEVFYKSPATAILWPTQLGQRDEAKSLLLDRPFTGSDEKNAVLDEMKGKLAGITKSASVVDEVCAVADEFVTNALYNAPYVDPITFAHRRINRLTTAVKLAPGKVARLFLAEDGKRLLIGVQDPFGSLNIKAYLEKISKCYATGVQESINFGEGGAGIGSYIIFNTGSSLYYGVKPGQVTLLACVVPYRASRRQREDMPKHLHWIK